MTHYLDLLAFAPHPDDAEIFCGGWLLLASHAGYKTGIVDLTAGEMSSNGDLLSRAEETNAASAILQLSHRENLGLPDAWLHPYAGYDSPPETRPDSPLARIVETLRRLRPSLVLIPWKEDRHPDHVAASELLTKALFFSNLSKFQTSPPRERFLPLRTLFYPLRSSIRPSFVVDISSVFSKKQELLLAYKSQFRPHDTSTSTLINSPLALDAIEAKDRYYGAQIGSRAGEPYLCQATLALSDPIAFFQGQAPQPPHFFERLP